MTTRMSSNRLRRRARTVAKILLAALSFSVFFVPLTFPSGAIAQTEGPITDTTVAMTDNPDDPVTPGGIVTFSITVTNNGPLDTVGVTVDFYTAYNADIQTFRLYNEEEEDDCTIFSSEGNSVYCDLEKGRRDQEGTGR